MKAALPAIDLLRLNVHLLLDPYRRPIRSARPSPQAIVASDTMPIAESFQNSSVNDNKTMTYMNGPPRDSRTSPDRDIAPASSDSELDDIILLPVPARYNRNAFNNGTILAKTRAPYAFENIGQSSMNNGAERVCIIFLESRGSIFPTLALYVIVLTKTVANTMQSAVEVTSCRTSCGVYGLEFIRTPNGSVVQNCGEPVMSMGGPGR